MDLSVNLAGVNLKNPVIPASGTAAYGQEMAAKFDLNKLGSLVIKSTTAKPWAGNPHPTTAQTSAGWLNSVGLKNPGIDNVMSEKLPWLAEHYPDLPIIGSVAGNSVADYVAVAKKMAQAPNVKILEINISCPNVEKGGLAFGTDPQVVEDLTRQITTAVDKPVFMKLTPNVTDIKVIAKAAEKGGAAGLTMINTLLGMEINLETRKPHLSHGFGGLSGTAIHPLAVYMIHQARQVTKLPIIGVGGINTPEDILEMYLAGANAVEVGSPNVMNKKACPELVEQLPAVMEKYGFGDHFEIK